MTDPEIPDRGYNTSDVAAIKGEKKQGFARRNWGKLLLIVLVAVPALFVTIWTLGAMSYAYSTGERVGFVQKLSKKGWVCKTWEGELQISNIPGSAPSLFSFTVRDDSIARAIQAAEGQQVALVYDQHVGVPLSCIGDTEYFISGVRVVRPQPGYLLPASPGVAPAPVAPPTPSPAPSKP